MGKGWAFFEELEGGLGCWVTRAWLLGDARVGRGTVVEAETTVAGRVGEAEIRAKFNGKSGEFYHVPRGPLKFIAQRLENYCLWFTFWIVLSFNIFMK